MILFLNILIGFPCYEGGSLGAFPDIEKVVATPRDFKLTYCSWKWWSENVQLAPKDFSNLWKSVILLYKAIPMFWVVLTGQENLPDAMEP